MVDIPNSSEKKATAKRNDQKFQVEFDFNGVNYLLKHMNTHQRKITESKALNIINDIQ